MQKLGRKALVPPGKNVKGDASYSRVLLSLTSGGRKIKEVYLMTED